MIPSLKKLVRPDLPENMRILGADPGGTTGLCLFEGTHLIKATQLELSIQDLDRCLASFLPINHAVVEDYRVYAQYAKAHTSSGLPTVRLIGAMSHWLYQHDIPCTLEMAATAKQFVDNKKLKTWDLYQVGMKHSNDAIRHVVYYMIFGEPKSHYKSGHRVG